MSSETLTSLLAGEAAEYFARPKQLRETRLESDGNKVIISNYRAGSLIDRQERVGEPAEVNSVQTIYDPINPTLGFSFENNFLEFGKVPTKVELLHELSHARYFQLSEEGQNEWEND